MQSQKSANQARIHHGKPDPERIIYSSSSRRLLETLKPGVRYPCGIVLGKSGERKSDSLAETCREGNENQ